MSLALPATKYKSLRSGPISTRRRCEDSRVARSSVGRRGLEPAPERGQFERQFPNRRARSSAGQSLPHGDRWAASADYFSTMKIPIFRGRFFDDRDTMESQPVAIIDEAMARKYWPDEDPLGKRISFQFVNGNRIWREIVGIVGHVRHRGLEGESRVQYYVPHSQTQNAFMSLVVRETLTRRA